MMEQEGQLKGADQFYVWFDTEYSTLELETALLLQVAALITDTSLKRVLPPEQDVRLTIRIPDGKAISPWVEQNLPDLIKTCRSSQAVDVALADDRLAAYVDTVAGLPAERENQRPVLAGNSVHADWWLIRRFLPHFLGRLHYRHLDVTALKLEWLHLQPRRNFKRKIRKSYADTFQRPCCPTQAVVMTPIMTCRPPSPNWLSTDGIFFLRYELRIKPHARGGSRQDETFLNS